MDLGVFVQNTCDSEIFVQYTCDINSYHLFIILNNTVTDNLHIHVEYRETAMLAMFQKQKAKIFSSDVH